VFHLEPESIGHLRAAAARGYGSLELSDVAVSGDITLDQARERTATWDVNVIRVEEAHGNIRVLSGEPYCHGGCHGVFLDWLYMIKDRKPKLWRKLRSWTVVIGSYKGDVTADRVLLLGSCTAVDGRIRARKVRRINGCPPRHKTLVLGLFLKAGIWNPLIRPELVFDGYVYQGWAILRRFLKGRL
jgi:hypothetical protein